ncbi:MAG: glycosyltransferase family 4 protein [Calditrichaeota bacterium]|nr:glycosyltransferase family 4 protein [Calditrichota bacterium]
MADFPAYRIALFTSFPLDVTVGSGVVRMINGYYKALTRLNQNVDLIHPDFKAESYLNLAVQRISFNKKIVRKNWRGYDLIIGSDFDGFALNSVGTPKIVLNAGILADIVRFEKGRTAEILKHLARRECRNVRQAETVVVPSQYAAGKVGELYGVDFERIKIIPLGIDLLEWENRLKRVEVEENRNPTILCVARQYPRKGVSDLIKAFARVCGIIPEVRLNIVGGGPDFLKNRKLAKESGIERFVRFEDDLADEERLAYFYKSADIFCLPSYHETFGIVFLEAMTAGLPIVTCGTTAIPEVVSKEEGFLCAPGDCGDLSNKLLTLLQNPRLRKKMGERGKKKVRNFGWDRSGFELMRLIQTLLASGIENKNN